GVVLATGGGDHECAVKSEGVGSQLLVQFGFLPAGLHADEDRVAESGRFLQGLVVVDLCEEAVGWFGASVVLEPEADRGGVFGPDAVPVRVDEVAGDFAATP